MRAPEAFHRRGKAQAAMAPVTREHLVRRGPLSMPAAAATSADARPMRAVRREAAPVSRQQL